jgi:hypothetical protein
MNLRVLAPRNYLLPPGYRCALLKVKQKERKKKTLAKGCVQLSLPHNDITDADIV